MLLMLLQNDSKSNVCYELALDDTKLQLAAVWPALEWPLYRSNEVGSYRPAEGAFIAELELAKVDLLLAPI